MIKILICFSFLNSGTQALRFAANVNSGSDWSQDAEDKANEVSFTSTEYELAQAAIGGWISEQAQMDVDAPKALYMYERAQKEEGNISVKGHPRKPYLIMWPRSYVKKFDEILSSVPKKIHKYNFVGSSWEGGRVRGPARAWIMPFVKEHFSEKDYFVDVMGKAKFNSSFDSSASWIHRQKSLAKGIKLDSVHVKDFDDNYFKSMAESEFTLCPAGDSPWSYRFVEAMFMKSIPIVKDSGEANTEEVNCGWPRSSCFDRTNKVFKNKELKFTPNIGFHYYVYNPDPNFQYVYNETWAEENLKLVRQHHTLMAEFGEPMDNRGNQPNAECRCWGELTKVGVPCRCNQVAGK